ncbi:MAG: hypothetical protein K2J73_04185 [Oscillospiraceae bacterium]|nr:hypothetical protein [Oscillospiraceae bacterium]
MMKKIISFFTALSLTLMLFTGMPINVSAEEDIAIDETNFPDENFRNYISETFDTDNNGSLSDEEIANVNTIYVYKKNIADLTGIAFFTDLEALMCSNNNLTSLNVSKNTALMVLECNNNQLTELDLSQNTVLTNLECYGNQLTKLDLSKNTALIKLSCNHNNLTSLDVSQSTKLESLFCYENELTSLNVSNTELKFLSCYENELTSLNVSNTELEVLYCSNNKLTSLDVSQITTLTDLECNFNQLTSLNVSSTALESLDCSNNKLTSLNVSSTALEFLYCSNNELTSLDVSQIPTLAYLVCDSNQLTSLDLSKNNALEYISCKNNTHTVLTCVLDPATLPAGFDLSKTSNWTNNVEITDDNKIFYLGTGDVTYTYDLGNSLGNSRSARLNDDSQSGIFTLVFPARELTKVDEKEATCTEDGNIEYYECSCGYKFKNENPTAADILNDEAVVTTASGHNYQGEWTSDDNEHWHECTVCNDKKDISNHAWNSGTVTTPPTEEAEGEKTYTCTDCSATKTEIVDKLTHTHTLTAHDAVSATCTTDGNEAYWTCSSCNKMFSDENGTTEITEIPTIAATGHAYSTDWTSNETSHWHAATCGHDVISEAAAHTEDNGTVTVPATTENDGLKTFSCDVCGYLMRTEVIPKLDEDHTHSFSPDWKHDSTNHWHECDCGEKSDNSVHIENSGVVTTEPTETSTGIMTYSCTVCGYVIRTDVIPALTPEHTHTFGTDWKYDSVSHWHECECGEKSELAGHTSSDWIVETPATTDLEGVQIKRCTVCGIELDRETIEKLPNINTGGVAEDVQDTAGTNAGLVQDNTLIENVLTPEDNAAVENGSSFEIVLEVTDIRDSVPPADVAAASSALRSNEKIGIYVDLSLFKIKDNIERTPIYNTSGQIGITLTIPDSIYASDRTYSIIRVHEGTAENLGGTYDKTSRRLTFYTDKFSTYAIAYTASNGGTDRPSIPSTPPTGGTTPVSPSVPVVTPTVTETTVKKEDEIISDEPYTEDVSSAAGVTEDSDIIDFGRNVSYSFLIVILILGIGFVYFKKSRQK